MEPFTHLRKPANRSCSLGDKMSRSHTSHVMTATRDRALDDDGTPRRRITVASYMPQSTEDQNGNFPEKDLDKQQVKSLREFNTDEVCQWFGVIGLQRCLPFIKEANLCGADIASVDVNILDLLHISTLEEREQLLAAIYQELHPPSTTSQTLDSLLETFGPNNVERFTAALVSMSKSKSSPHVSCLYMNRSSMKLRNRSHSTLVQRNSQLMEITINAQEQIVHLRTPTETLVGKVMESCIRMLGLTEDKALFTLRDKQGSSEDLSPELQIGALVTVENRQLELHLCKKEKPNAPETPRGSHEKRSSDQSLQETVPGREEKIKELNQQVDSLQNVILQVQELHHGLVAFCSELKRLDAEAGVSGLSPTELEARLGAAQRQLGDRKRSLQTLMDAMGNAAAHRNKQSEVRLLDKMKLNCQVFQEEISLVHLNRQVAQLQTALQHCQDKEKKAQRSVPSLGQLVGPRGPSMLLLLEESQGPDGRYGFTCRTTQGLSPVVTHTLQSHLRLDDRLVEVNGVPVVGYSEEDLSALLYQGPSAQVVVLRKPPTPTTPPPEPPAPTTSPTPPPNTPPLETPPTMAPPKPPHIRAPPTPSLTMAPPKPPHIRAPPPHPLSSWLAPNPLPPHLPSNPFIPRLPPNHLTPRLPLNPLTPWLPPNPLTPWLLPNPLRSHPLPHPLTPWLPPNQVPPWPPPTPLTPWPLPPTLTVRPPPPSRTLPSGTTATLTPTTPSLLREMLSPQQRPSFAN